jgi:hypothetical protein
MHSACVLQLAALGRNHEHNRQGCVVVQERAVAPGEACQLTAMCTGHLLCKVIVVPTAVDHEAEHEAEHGMALVLPTLTIQAQAVAWELQGGAGAGAGAGSHVYAWAPPVPNDMRMPDDILLDNTSVGCVPCSVLTVSKIVPDFHPGAPPAVVPPGGLMPVWELGLSAPQRVYEGGCSGFLSLPHCRPADSAGPVHLEDVVDEVRWVAGLTGSLMVGEQTRLRITPALTDAVQCQAVGRVVNGWCCVPLGTIHVGRIMRVVDVEFVPDV